MKSIDVECGDIRVATRERGRRGKERMKRKKLLPRIGEKRAEYKTNQPKVYADLNYNPEQDKNKQNNHNRAQ